MRIKVLGRCGNPPYNSIDTIFLTWYNWNDYSYYTLFGMLYVDDSSEVHEIGAIKLDILGNLNKVEASQLETNLKG